MKATILMDNVTYGNGFRAEHGFSALIEAGSARILFDTGQTGAFLRNAETMGIDLSAVDAVVLSHGHYDHTGGLADFCRVNSRAVIYGKPACLAPKFSGTRPNGMPEDSRNLRDRFVLLDESRGIAAGIFVLTKIPIVNEWDTHFKGLSTGEAGSSAPDTFEDELYLAISEGRGLAVVTGCSHRGATNIALAARSEFDCAPELILGGFHLRNEGPEAADRLIGELDRLGVNRVGVCHCTGIDGYARIKSRRPDGSFYAYAGSSSEL